MCQYVNEEYVHMYINIEINKYVHVRTSVMYNTMPVKYREAARAEERTCYNSAILDSEIT